MNLLTLSALSVISWFIQSMDAQYSLLHESGLTGVSHKHLHQYAEPTRYQLDPMVIVHRTQNTSTSSRLAGTDSKSAKAHNDGITAHVARVAIVIDDLGHNWQRDQETIELPSEVGLAVLPNSPFGLKIARQGWRRGHEILIHLPLQGEDSENAEPDTLTTVLSKEAFLLQLRDSLRKIPYAIGVNNHQGSVLTSSREPMVWLMQELKRLDRYYFLDSRTTSSSVAMKTAREIGVPALSRRVFLDHHLNVDSMDSAFEEWLQIARREGQAIAIAHPHPMTVEWLMPKLNKLRHQGVELVPPTALLSQVPGRMAAMRPPSVMSAVNEPIAESE